MTLQADEVLDVSGLPCPLPLLKAKQALAGMGAGELLEVRATDAGSWRDFETFIQQSRHQMPEREMRGDVYHYWIRKAMEPTP